MSSEYYESEEVEKLASKLLPNFVWPEQPRIKFLVLAKEKSSYLGKCSKATGKWKHLTNTDFVIEVLEDFWDSALETQRQALLFHELCHVDYKEDEETSGITWKIRKHDVEEFYDVTKRYGTWNEPLKNLKDILTDTGVTNYDLTEEKVDSN